MYCNDWIILLQLGGSIIWQNERRFNQLEGLLNKKVIRINIYGQALSAAFENPSNHTNEDLGKVEELMQVLKDFLHGILP